ncbi:MAG TPA: tetratricopeptide repeat protein [Kofleriaceae bacterium]|nr:tetratricopeptide repeat protein [Kofleriaceae bacterium]
MLTQDGVPVPLGRKAVAVLTELIRAAPEYVPKSRILDVAWPGVVVEENNLAVQISSIRRVLAAADGDRWIETLTARGYRFVGPLTRIPPTSAGTDHLVRPKPPEALTSFIGRERELAELRTSLSRARLLTLTGAGGVGKTRLALSLADSIAALYRDGWRLVDLSTLHDPELVPQAAVAALGLQEQRGKDLTQTLCEHLEAKQVLLVLDNAEHLLDACARLVDTVLRRCPHVTVLATSRERLGVPGELIYRVPSLSVPDEPLAHDALHLLDYEAVRLFRERARLHLSTFEISERNARAIASICRRLDGIALAIELAAARVRSLTVEEIEARLDDRFALLTTASRTLPARQQTLRGAVDWSYDLLSEAERALFRALSVFGGHFALDTVESVCVGPHVERADVLELLTSLADKSLIIVDEVSGRTRYRMLETVQQYADARRQESQDGVDWRARHLGHFVALAEEAERELTGEHQQAWLDRLDAEHGNLRVALTYASTAEREAGLRLATSISRFWLVRGFLSEGRGWLARLLAGGDEADPASRAKALNWAGVFAWKQGDYAASSALYEQALAIRRALQDRRGIGAVLNNQGLLAYEQGDYARARTLHEQSLAIDRELGDRWGVAVSLVHLASLASMQGDYRAARTLSEESVAIFRELGDRSHVANALRSLGNVLMQQGDDRAEAHFRESLAICRELGDRSGIARALHGLGVLARHARDRGASALLDESLAIARELGDREGEANTLHDLGKLAAERRDYRSARRLHADSLRIYRALGERCGSACAIEALACVALATDHAVPAIELWGAMNRLREEIGAAVPTRERDAYDHDLASARTTLGDANLFDRIWQDGRRLSLDEAIARALKDD